jgi:hypothetical protein
LQFYLDQLKSVGHFIYYVLSRIIANLFRRHLVTESRNAPACQQVQHMNGLIHSFGNPITASRKTRSRKDSSEACRERASADLLKAVTMLTANERLTLERSASNWSLRADLLEDAEGRAAERRASISPSSAGDALAAAKREAKPNCSRPFRGPDDSFDNLISKDSR